MHRYQAMELFIDQIEQAKRGEILFTKDIFLEFRENIKGHTEDEIANVLIQVELRTRINPVLLVERLETHDSISQEELLALM